MFSNHLKASEFVHGLNNAVITEQHPFILSKSIAFAFNTLYEQAHDIYRLIVHLEHSVILTGYLIDTDTVSPDKVCHAMNRQTRLSEKEQHDLVIVLSAHPTSTHPFHCTETRSRIMYT